MLMRVKMSIKTASLTRGWCFKKLVCKQITLNKSALGSAVVIWCIFGKQSSTNIHKGMIFMDAQQF